MSNHKLSGEPWHERMTRLANERDLQNLHRIRAACRSLRDQLAAADWFISVSHDFEYKTIIVNVCNFDEASASMTPGFWDGFPVSYRPRTRPQSDQDQSNQPNQPNQITP